MKIVFVLPNLFSGGAERVTTVLARNMVESGYKVDIALLIDDIVQYEVDERVKVYFLRTKGLTRYGRIKCLRSFIKSELKNDRVVLIPFQDSCLKNVLIASIGLDVRVIGCERNNPYRKGVGIYRKLKASIPFLLADACVFQTAYARDYYSMLNDEKCVVIPNPITLQKNRWAKVVDPRYLICVCRLHPQKNIPMLIDAISIVRNVIPNIKVHIYGEGTTLNELIQYSKEKGTENSVVFEGRTDDVIEKLCTSSIYISTSDFEGISNSMLEAMSVGMPIICTNCPIGGASMMLSDNAGVLVPVGDSEKLAEKIVSLLKDPTSMCKYGERAYQKSTLYSEKQITNLWIDYINKVLING